MLIFSDDSHLAAPFARGVAPVMLRRLEPVIGGGPPPARTF